METIASITALWTQIKRGIAAVLATASTTEEEAHELEERIAEFVKALHTLLVESGVELLPHSSSEISEELYGTILFAKPEQNFAPVVSNVRKAFRNITKLGNELQDVITQIEATELAAQKHKERWIHQLFLCYAASWPVTVCEDQLDFFAKHAVAGHPSWAGIAGIVIAIRGKLSLPVMESLALQCPEPPEVGDRSRAAKAVRAQRGMILRIIKELRKYQ